MTDIAHVEDEAALTADEARDLTDRIRAALDIAWQFVIQAWKGRAWASLGYGSWDDYCTREFGAHRLRLPREERQEVVGSLRDAGMSIRAIAAATGVDGKTVRNDLKPPGEEYSPPELGLDVDEDVVDAELLPEPAPPPRPVTGMDGKTYHPAARPAPRPAPAPAPGPPARPHFDDYVDEELAKIDALAPEPTPTADPPQLVTVTATAAQFRRIDLSNLHPGFRTRARQAIDDLGAELARIKETLR